MFLVDTNVLLHAVNPDSPDHEAARSSIETWRAGEAPWFLTWAIAYEFLRVSTHPKVFPEPLDLLQARGWLKVLLATPNVGVLIETERHGEVLDDLVDRHSRLRGNVLHDLHTVALMREHGVSEIRTADTDFHQFPFLDVVNPLDRS